MADIRTLKLQLLADTAQFSTGLNKASTDTQSFTSKVDKIVATAAKAFLGLATAVGTAAFAIGVSAVKAAIEDEKAQVSLAQTLRNTTKATDQQIAATEDYIDATARATGIADDQLRPSLDRLVRSTQDVTKAQKLQQLALDIAAGTGKDLAAVTEALGKAYDGNLGALKRIGVPLDENIVKTKDFDAAVKALSETFAGQAAAAAETFAGRMQRVQIAVDEAKEQIGFALLPFMEKLAKFVTDNLVPALEGLVNGLTRTGKQGLTKAFYDAGTGAVTFGYDLESTEGQAYLLGEQIRQLGDAIGKLLAIDPSTGDSLLIKLIDSLTKIIEKTEAAVRAFERFKESFVGGALLDISTAPIRTVGAALSGNPGQVININNTFGATNSKAQAQTVVKSINNAAKAGTVNKFVKPMIPGR
jgi:SpoU rRNA methylase family enzyme